MTLDGVDALLERRMFPSELMNHVVMAIGVAHILNEDLLARALTVFEPSESLDAALDAAEIAMTIRLIVEKHVTALHFRPWARRVLERAADVLEAAGAACDLACALHRVASPATEVSHAHA
jgi:hypothetical protein